MSELRVNLGERSYAVMVEFGLSSRVAELLTTIAPARRYFVITDTTVRSLYSQVFPSDSRYRMCAVPSGEASKSLQQLDTIWTFLLREEIERRDVVVAFGGGMIGDLAGFAAASVLRGVRLVQVPTTLLAQVDASIGGKTGINHPLGKNMIGAFHQPEAVLIDPAFLQSLPDIEFQSGMYEVIKYALIESNSLYDRLMKGGWNNGAEISDIIESCVRCKADVVSSDERESGRRMILNFGHTLGHAIEVTGQFQRFTHGQAVGWGMLFAGQLAEAIGLCSPSAKNSIEKLVRLNGELPPLACSAVSLLDCMRRDKKVKDGRLTFILPKSVGEVVIEPGIPESLVKEELEEFLS